MNKAFYLQEKREKSRKKKESSIMFLVSVILSGVIFFISSRIKALAINNVGVYFVLIYILINTVFCAIMNIVELITLNK